MVKFISLLIAINYLFAEIYATANPNIIVIMADDLGWDDVSFHGQDDILTPNIDALAYYGISLNRHYASPMCTPTRGSFLTGKYPIHLGLQHYVIANDEPWGLGLDQKILPQYLKKVGYDNYLVGKWHLGMYKRSYTPTRRGFDKFYGYLGGFTTYYSHDIWMLNHPLWTPGYDMRDNETVDWTTRGIYMTDLLTDKAIKMIVDHDKTRPMFMILNHLAPHAGNDFYPLEAPLAEIKKLEYITNPIRRKLAAVISLMDTAIGKLIRALYEFQMLENSVILFMSDNGAPSLGQLYNFGSNYPLKGKDTPWEGATRVASAIWSPLLVNRERASNQLFHISDWLPTFANLAGVSSLPGDLDGYDIWDALSMRSPSPRTSIVHNIDDYVSYMKGDYKYVKGTRTGGIFDWWIGDIMRNINVKNPYPTNYYNVVRNSEAGKLLSQYSLRRGHLTDGDIQVIRDASTVRCEKIKKNNCASFVQPCLFNIERDPCEFHNLYWTHQAVVSDMELDILQIRPTILEKRNVDGDPRSEPKENGGAWTWWQGEA